MKNEGDSYGIITGTEQFEAVKSYLEEQKIKLAGAEVTMLPQTTVSITDREEAGRILKLMEALEDHDDVQNVYANFDIPEEYLD